MSNSVEDFIKMIEETVEKENIVEDFIEILHSLSMEQPPSLEELIKVSDNISKMTKKSIETLFFKNGEVSFNKIIQLVSREQDLSQRPTRAWILLEEAVGNIPHPMMLPGILIILIPVLDKTINEYKASIN